MSVAPIITLGVGPQGSVLYALTGGFGIADEVVPTSNDISSFLVSLRAGRMEEFVRAGNFSVRTHT